MLAPGPALTPLVKAVRSTLRVSTVTLMDGRAVNLLRRIQKTIIIDSLSQSSLRVLNRGIMLEYFKAFFTIIKGVKKEAGPLRQLFMNGYDKLAYASLFDMAGKSLVELVKELIQKKESHQGSDFKFIISRLIAVGIPTAIRLMKSDDWDLIIGKARRAIEEYLIENPQPKSLVILDYFAHRATYEEAFLLIANCGVQIPFNPSKTDSLLPFESKAVDSVGRTVQHRSKMNLAYSVGRTTIGLQIQDHRKGLTIAAISSQLERRVKMVEEMLERMQVGEEYDDIRTFDSSVMAASKLSRSIDSKSASLSKSKDSSDDTELANRLDKRKKAVRIMLPKQRSQFMQIVNAGDKNANLKDSSRRSSQSKLVHLDSSQIVTGISNPRSAIKKISKFTPVQFSKSEEPRGIIIPKESSNTQLDQSQASELSSSKNESENVVKISNFGNKEEEFVKAPKEPENPDSQTLNKLEASLISGKIRAERKLKSRSLHITSAKSTPFKQHQQSVHSRSAVSLADEGNSLHVGADDSQDRGAYKPAPISLQLRDFYKLSCGISSRFGFQKEKRPGLKSGGTSQQGLDSFIIKEKITSQGSIMGKLLDQINESVGTRDGFRVAIKKASKQWESQKQYLAIKERIYSECDTDDIR